MDPRISLVTGGASGIGLAVARTLRLYGPVIVADIDDTALADAEEEGFDSYRMDVRDSGQWRSLESYIAEKYGRIDALVHNAGSAPISSLVKTSDKQFDLAYATNVRSILVGTREMWDLLVSSRGSVVNVASVAALVGQNHSAAYVASKGAVVALTRALAIELAPFGVRVNSVCPGTTMTPLLERHFNSIPAGKEAKDQLTRRHPLGRLLAPEDVAPSIVHLLWEETAGAMTGTNVVVDGGLTASFDYGNSFAGGGEGDA